MSIEIIKAKDVQKIVKRKTRPNHEITEAIKKLKIGEGFYCDESFYNSLGNFIRTAKNDLDDTKRVFTRRRIDGKIFLMRIV